MINKTIIIIAISINITFQFSFILCTVYRTPQVFSRKSATQVELLKDIIQQKSLKHKDIYPEKETWGKTDKDVSASRDGGTQLKNIATSALAEVKTNHQTKLEDNVRKDKLPHIELKHSTNTDDQQYIQKKPELDTSLMAKYTDEIEQWRANLEKKQSMPGGIQELEEMNEKDLEREIRMWKEGNNGKMTQDWKENYSQQGLPLTGIIGKFTYKQEKRDEGSGQNENQYANQKSRLTEQDVEKQIRLWTDAHPNKEIKELKKQLDAPPLTNDPTSKILLGWKEKQLQLEKERNKWFEQQIELHLSSIEKLGLQKVNENKKENLIKNESVYYERLKENEDVSEEEVVPAEEVVPNPVTDKEPVINISIGESDESSDSVSDEDDEPTDVKTIQVNDKKEESQKPLSSSEKKALQWKEILLKTNNDGQKTTNTKSIESKVREELAKIMASEDKNPIKTKNNNFVKAMTNIANSTKIKIKELLKKQLKNQMGNNTLIKMKPKKNSLRSSLLKHKSATNKAPGKCIQKCFAPKCKVQCLGHGASAACSANSCSAVTRGLDSASLCTGELCDALCYKEQCIAACEGPVCFAKCQGKTCHAVSKGRASQSACMKDDCMAYATGPEVNTKCIGANCQAQCMGLNCEARCEGSNCIAGCSGEKCRAVCSGRNCQKSISPDSNIDEIPITKPDYIEGDVTSDEDVSALKEDEGGIDNQGQNFELLEMDDDTTNDDEKISLNYAINVQLTDQFIDSIKKKLTYLRNSNLLRLLPKTLSNI